MSNSTCNSIFFLLELKNRDILLNSFKIKTFYCIICKLWTNINFSQEHSPQFTLTENRREREREREREITSNAAMLHLSLSLFNKVKVIFY